MELAFDPDAFAGALLIADVDLTGQVVADENRRESRSDSVLLNELRDPAGEFLLESIGGCLAIENTSGHVGMLSAERLQRGTGMDAGETQVPTKTCRQDFFFVAFFLAALAAGGAPAVFLDPKIESQF